MPRPTHLPIRSLLLACCLAAAYPASAQVAGSTSTSTGTTATTTTTTTTTTAVGTSATTEAKLSTEFADFLGGQEQAKTVISGLRQGSAFELTTASTTTGTPGTPTATTGTTTTTTTIDPPTGTMGYGNIRIALRLAQAELGKLGITQPTPEELSAILVGGDLNGTQANGILTLRADGMGWGQIAKEYGFSVGQLMGNGAGLTKQTATTAPQSKGGTASTTSTARANGYIPSSPSKSTTSVRANGYIPSGKGGTAVTAAGGSVGGTAQGLAKGHANKPAAVHGGAASGAVSAGGSALAASGATNAGGGNALAPGQVKKN